MHRAWINNIQGLKFYKMTAQKYKVFASNTNNKGLGPASVVAKLLAMTFLCAFTFTSFNDMQKYKVKKKCEKS